MSQITNNKQYDLEDRTFSFAKEVRVFIQKLSKSIGNSEDIRQVIRASGSVASNYIEANESLSKKDFVMRIKICKKESKETRLWLRLLDTGGDSELEKERRNLIIEATQLMKIFGSILEKSK